MTISGEYDFLEFKSYLKIIHAKCLEEEVSKILFDARDVLSIDIKTMERYFLGTEAAEILQYKIKIAVVWENEYTNYFFETVAINRGANVKIFGNIEPATNWLLAKNNE